jgi:hypothetical protein
MSERWERELRKLDEVDAPTGLSDRIAEGPTGGGGTTLPGTRQRIVAGVVAFGVFIAAGAFAFVAFSGGEPEPIGTDDAEVVAAPTPEEVVVTISSGDGPNFRPSAVIAYGDEQVGIGCVSWWVEFPDGTGEAMEAFCGGNSGLVVDLDAPFSFITDGGVAVAVTVRPDDPTSEPGKVTVQIEASWPSDDRWSQASATFVTALEIVEPAVSPPVEPVDDPIDVAPEPSVVAEEPSDVLRIRCTPTEIEVLTPVVAAQPDGLHVLAEIQGLADPEVAIRSDGHPDSEWWSGSSGTDGEFVRNVPPGRAVVRCESGPEQGDGPEELETRLEIVDPTGVTVPYTLGCERPEAIGPGGSLAVRADTLDGAVREGVRGVLDSDAIEEAGYVASDSAWRIARLVRDGNVVAFFHVDGRGAWAYRVMSGYACAGSDLGPLASDEEVAVGEAP